jgi:hypothetical protein
MSDAVANMTANRRLAELLGWTDIFDIGGALLGTPPPGAPACRNQAKVPDWTGDWRDCGPLLVEHLRRLTIWPHRSTACAPSSAPAGVLDWMRERGPGETGDDVTRQVVVEAVIAALEARL